MSLTCILAMSAEAQEPVKAIGQEEFMKEIFNYRSDTVQPVRPTLVDFWAPWCAPCLRLSPIIDSLAVKYKGQVDFRKLNIDENKDLARDLGINSIPLYNPKNEKTILEKRKRKVRPGRRKNENGKFPDTHTKKRQRLNVNKTVFKRCFFMRKNTQKVIVNSEKICIFT